MFNWPSALNMEVCLLFLLTGGFVRLFKVEYKRRWMSACHRYRCGSTWQTGESMRERDARADACVEVNGEQKNWARRAGDKHTRSIDFM
jgi:hypothetical protein